MQSTRTRMHESERPTDIHIQINWTDLAGRSYLEEGERERVSERREGDRSLNLAASKIRISVVSLTFPRISD